MDGPLSLQPPASLGDVGSVQQASCHSAISCYSVKNLSRGDQGTSLVEPEFGPGRARVRRRAALRLEVQRPPQLTAFFTSAPILASAAAVNSFSAKATGHTVPSSRFALSLKPNVAYLVLNLCALWKKQTTLPSLAYAGIPYQVLGERAGALALMMAWSRSAMARSGFGIPAIFARTSPSPSAVFAPGPRRASAFSSWTRSFIAARSSSVNPLTTLLADFCVSVFGLIEPPHY